MATVTKAKLVWPQRPRRGNHNSLGRVQYWTTACGAYRVERFPEYSGRYLALYSDPRMGGVWHLLSRHVKLGPAQRACERHGVLRKDG